LFAIEAASKGRHRTAALFQRHSPWSPLRSSGGRYSAPIRRAATRFAASRRS